MFQRSEGHFKGYRDCNLFFQKWSVANPQGHIVITHGQAEHSWCYQRLVDALTPLQMNIFAWDLRGHGRSDGQRGYAENFEDYCQDFQLFLKKLTLEKEIVSKPLVLLSHSMGGLIQMKLMCDYPDLPVTALIFSAPMFGLSVDVPAAKNWAAQWVNQLIPRLTLYNEIKFEMLTRETQIIKEFEADPYRHDRICSGVYLGSLKAMSYVQASCARVHTPCLLQMSEKDPVTNTEQAVRVINNIKSDRKEIKLYPNRMHEIYNDLDRDEVYKDLIAFITNNLSLH